jgi:hypothetical protein
MMLRGLHTAPHAVRLPWYRRIGMLGIWLERAVEAQAGIACCTDPLPIWHPFSYALKKRLVQLEQPSPGSAASEAAQPKKCCRAHLPGQLAAPARHHHDCLPVSPAKWL